MNLDTPASLEERLILGQNIASASYTVGNTSMVCRLCQMRGEVDPSVSFAIILQDASNSCCVIKGLTSAQAQKLYDLFTQNQISLCHVSDVLEDLAICHTRHLWTTF